MSENGYRGTSALGPAPQGDTYTPVSEVVPVSKYVYVVLNDDCETTISGALVGNYAGNEVLELRGASVAVSVEGRRDPAWKPLDGPVIVFKSRVLYIVERP